MKSLAIFLTHNFKPIFSDSLRRLDSSLSDGRMDSMVLFDEEAPFDNSMDGQLNNIEIHRIKTPLRSYDPISKAHNFPIEYFRLFPEKMDEYDYFWIVENDVYWHGNFRTFFDKHDLYDFDLLVPEFGLRNLDWGWLHNMVGIEKVIPCGVTAVIHRLSRRLLKELVQKVGIEFSGHLEALLPHVCFKYGYTIQQFIPSYFCAVNTFKRPFLKLIEEDLKNGTNYFIEGILYHPIKM